MPGILGKKVGMTRIIQDDGRVIPLTVVECTPNVITQVKTTEKDGYPAIVLGFDALSKPMKTQKFHHMKEFKIVENPDGNDQGLEKGAELTVSRFEIGEVVKVTGVSKGKGFQGVMKRHHFRGGPRSHGSHFKREPGSIGMRAKPGKVIKGMRMAGQMGNENITLREATIVYVDLEKNLLGIKGPIPGSKGTLVIIRKNISKK